MKKLVLFVLLLVATSTVNAQEYLYATYQNNNNGTISCSFRLYDRWPAGYLVANDYWCSLTLVEVLADNSEHTLSYLSVPYPSGLFHTIDVVNTLNVDATVYSGAATSKYYVRIMQYYPLSGSSLYMVKDTKTYPSYAN
ncbi:hypothetical protein [Chitinophaga defluvii]|uniref:Uncharacterized protein n=1 Tax=Chitinophaga defluvii TaxID=3163343 RepID=A0ABV2T654_9BACT